jgi:hypothetical protein
MRITTVLQARAAPDKTAIERRIVATDKRAGQFILD